MGKLMNVFSSGKDNTNKNLAIFLENLGLILSDKVINLVKGAEVVQEYDMRSYIGKDNAEFYCKLTCDEIDLIGVNVNISFSDKKIYLGISSLGGLNNSTVTTFKNEVKSSSKELGYELVEI